MKLSHWLNHISNVLAAHFGIERAILSTLRCALQLDNSYLAKVLLVAITPPMSRKGWNKLEFCPRVCRISRHRLVPPEPGSGVIISKVGSN